MSNFEDLKITVDAQAKTIQNLEGLVAKIKVWTVLIGFAGLVGGGLLTALGYYGVLRDEWGIWKQVKAAHDAPVPNSDTVVYNHSRLGDDDISFIKQSLGLPDFSKFTLKADLPGELADNAYVKIGDAIRLSKQIGNAHYYVSTDQPLSNAPNNNGYFAVVTAGARDVWKVERE